MSTVVMVIVMAMVVAVMVIVMTMVVVVVVMVMVMTVVVAMGGGASLCAVIHGVHTLQDLLFPFGHNLYEQVLLSVSSIRSPTRPVGAKNDCAHNNSFITVIYAPLN